MYYPLSVSHSVLAFGHLITPTPIGGARYLDILPFFISFFLVVANFWERPGGGRGSCRWPPADCSRSLLNHYSYATYLDHGEIMFLSAVRAVAAR